MAAVGTPSVVIYPSNPTVIYILPQQQQQQFVPSPAQPMPSGSGVFMPAAPAPAAQVPAGGSNAACCWMHRAPGQPMSLPPPRVGRPAQYVQFADGNVHWVPPRPG